MGINKVEFGDSTLIDLTGDTVTADTLAQGYTAHAANGDSITGTAFLADENTVDEINSKIGTTTDTGATSTTGTVMGKENFIIDSLRGGRQTFTSNGTFTVPQNVNVIYVTACGGGGGGNAGYTRSGEQGGGGGGGADFVKDYLLEVTPGTSISITVGTKGIGATASRGKGTAGTATIIGTYLTLAGGGSGSAYQDGGLGSGEGGNGGVGDSSAPTNGEGSAVAKGGSAGDVSGGGGASLGNGGNGGDYYADPRISGQPGGYGAGGGGGSSGSGAYSGGDGGDGICMISWGLLYK